MKRINLVHVVKSNSVNISNLCLRRPSHWRLINNKPIKKLANNYGRNGSVFDAPHRTPVNLLM
jgi:hypothetical protein